MSKRFGALSAVRNSWSLWSPFVGSGLMTLFRCYLSDIPSQSQNVWPSSTDHFEREPCCPQNLGRKSDKWALNYWKIWYFGDSFSFLLARKNQICSFYSVLIKIIHKNNKKFLIGQYWKVDLKSVNMVNFNQVLDVSIFGEFWSFVCVK